MATIEDDIIAAGAEILWVLEAGPEREAGTAVLCDWVMDELGSEGQGWCVGDAETEPRPGAFDRAPFSVDRGFEMIVDAGTMEIVFASSHGSGSGDDNLEPGVLLEEVRRAAHLAAARSTSPTSRTGRGETGRASR